MNHVYNNFISSGLYGGSKDSPEHPPTSSEEVTEIDGNAEETHAVPVNGTQIKSEIDCDIDELKSGMTNEAIKREMEYTDAVVGVKTEQDDFDNEDQNATDPLEEGEEKKQESGDALSALASAALDHSKDNKTDGNVIDVKAKDDKDKWFTIGFIKGVSYDVQNYFAFDNDTENLREDFLPDVSQFARINLEPGTAYKFRVAAINSVGRSDWSEVCIIF